MHRVFLRIRLFCIQLLSATTIGLLGNLLLERQPSRFAVIFSIWTVALVVGCVGGEVALRREWKRRFGEDEELPGQERSR